MGRGSLLVRVLQQGYWFRPPCPFCLVMVGAKGSLKKPLCGTTFLTVTPTPRASALAPGPGQEGHPGCPMSVFTV